MTGRLVPQSALTPRDRSAMFSLLDAHFKGVTPQQFHQDLEAKNWAVLIEESGELVGFSTLLVYPAQVGDELLTVVCSGDTIVAPAAWGSMAFPRSWIESVYTIRDTHSQGRLIWLLLTSGYRTYRFLPVFWREFYPRAGVQTPPTWRRMLNELATERFGAMFDSDNGIVRFTHPQQLRGELAGIPVGRDSDPDVQFFIRANSGHHDGDELVCIADLDPANLTPAGRRVVYGASACPAKH